ncbi:hypothetical protein [Nitrosomonas sp.]|uniref:hypothetical protein n=1 Tax=Nitrosomonas sp. TaxID=42353 RepID=UPI0025DBBDDA|nr:hypothetical protein [Nitrosomonas sp.]
MGSAALIMAKKYLPYLIVAIVVIGFLTWAISSIYKAGEASKNAEWLIKDAEQREALAKEMGEAMQRVADDRKKNEMHTMEVINERDRQISSLNNHLDDSKRVLIHTQNTACNGNAVPGKNNGTVDSGGATRESGIRVSGGYAEEVYVSEEMTNTIINDLHRQREELKIYFKACAAELRPLVNIVN